MHGRNKSSGNIPIFQVEKLKPELQIDFAKIMTSSRTTTKLQFLRCSILLSHVLLYFFKKSEPET